MADTPVIKNPILSPFVPVDGEPRANFAVFAGTKGQPQGGYRDYQGAFWSLDHAKKWAELLLAEKAEIHEWVQVVNTFHGAVHELIEGVWVQTHENDAGRVESGEPFYF